MSESLNKDDGGNWVSLSEIYQVKLFTTICWMQRYSYILKQVKCVSGFYVTVLLHRKAKEEMSFYFEIPFCISKGRPWLLICLFVAIDLFIYFSNMQLLIDVFPAGKTYPFAPLPITEKKDELYN